MTRALQEARGLPDILERLEQRRITQRVLRALVITDPGGAVSPRETTARLLFVTTCLMIVGVASGLIVPGLKMGWCFGEGDLMTWISFFSLLIAGILANKIWMARKSAGRPDKGIFVWRIFSFFFPYLAFDELLRFHEHLDRLLHYVLSMRQTDVSDHLDDAIVGLYGLIGLAILILYRNELLRFIGAWRYLLGAGICTVLTVVLDFAASAKHLLKKFIADPVTVQLVIDILDVIEEWFKVYAEVFFLGAFMAVLSYARARAGRPADPAVEASASRASPRPFSGEPPTCPSGIAGKT